VLPPEAILQEGINILDKKAANFLKELTSVKGEKEDEKS
jgi:hypothetical protein